MTQNTTVVHPLETAKTVAIDIVILATLYFLPTISHMLAFPVYMFEPMRIGIVLALAFTNRKNVYLLALTMPVFSFVIASHPVFIKSLLIGVEMALNVWLFFMAARFIKNTFVTMALSILISKMVYYTLKSALLASGMLTGELVSSPFLYQGIVLVVLSLFIFIVDKKGLLSKH